MDWIAKWMTNEEMEKISRDKIFRVQLQRERKKAETRKMWWKENVSLLFLIVFKSGTIKYICMPMEKFSRKVKVISYKRWKIEEQYSLKGLKVIRGTVKVKGGKE